MTFPIFCIRPQTARATLLAALCMAASGCVNFSAPPPLFTYGGPETTEKGTSEGAIALGTGVALFKGAHSGGSGWFGRYKYGVGQRWDLGVDFMGITRQDEGAFGGKLAARYQLDETWRLETGVGAVDDSDGKSLGADLGLTWGTRRPAPWNFYTTLRLAGAKGFRGDIVFSDAPAQEEDQIPPPDTFFTLLNFGAQGRVSDNQRFIIEGAYGFIFPEDHRRGPAFYFSAGTVFTIAP